MSDQLSSVFIIGSPRSGTSALSWALAEHPQMWTSAESNILFYLLRSPFIEEQYKHTLETHAEGTWLVQQNISYEEFAEHIGKGLDILWKSRSGGRIWVDATPAYTNIVPQLMTYFPQARFINIVRDGRAVVASMLKTNFPYPDFNDFEAACRSWVYYVDKGSQAMQDYPARVIELRHENLTRDPEHEFERLYAFLGLEPCAASSSFIRTKRINSSYLNVEKDDLRRKIKNPADMPKEPWNGWAGREQRLFSSICGETMTRLGYKYDFPDASSRVGRLLGRLGR